VDDIVTERVSHPDECTCLVCLMGQEIERLREWKSVADLFGVAFRVDEWGQYPPSNGDDVHKAVLAYERLKTKEARRG
jgi:hypothetical protein